MKRPQLAYKRRQVARGARVARTSIWATFVRLARKHAAVMTMVGGAFAWLLVSGGDAYSKVLAGWEWWRVDQTLSGRWSNDAEGDIEPTPWLTMNKDDVIELELRVRGSHLEGEVLSHLACKSFAWKMFELEGAKRWWGLGGIRFYAHDILYGKRTNFGEFSANYDRQTNTIEVKLLSDTRLFPKAARLSKLPERTASDPKRPPEDEGGYCPEHLKRMFEAIRQMDGTAQSATAASAPRKSASKPTSHERGAVL